MTIYSNPRMSLVVRGWPSGGKRVTAKFEIEANARGRERAVRVTTGAPKRLTYAIKARIVDGDDGLIYIAELTNFDFVVIMNGDMKFEHEVVHTDNPRYPDLLALFA